MLHSYLQDIRFALRMMRKSPGVTAIALLALTLGVGVTSAMFSLVYGVVLRALPYDDPARIVAIERVGTRGHSMSADSNRFVAWRDHQSSFESIAAFMSGSHVNLESGDRPERILVRSVTADFFRVLRVWPTAGRFFLPDEDRPAAAPVAVLGYGAWQRSFAGNSSVIGRSIQLGAKSYTVIGVAPAGMDTTLAADAFIPVDPVTSPLAGGFNFQVFGRLRDDVTLQQATNNMRLIADQMRAANSKSLFKQETAGAYSYQDEISSGVRPRLLMLLAAASLVLLIACANVANLQLARISARRREIAVRVALGASARRVVRQILCESISLGLVGSVLGLLFAKLAVSVVVSLKAIDLPRLEEVTVDWRIVLFSAALAILTGVLFGLAPAFRVLRTDPRDALAEGGARAGEGLASKYFRGSLVVLEYSLSVLLLVGALLLTESFVRLTRVDPGFDSTNALTAQMSLTGSRFQSPAQVAAFDEQLVAHVRQIPGVTAAATTNYLPLSGGFNIPLGGIEGQPNPEDKFLGNLEWFGITPDFFRAMGMRVAAGRAFGERDTAAAAPVVIVNQAFVRKYLPRQSALGQRITIAWSLAGKDAADAPREIVGVVSDIHEGSLSADPQPQTYVPVTQINAVVSAEVNSIMPTTLVVRTADGALTTSSASASSAATTRAIVEQIRAVDPVLPVFEVRGLQDVVSASVQVERFLLWLVGGFAIAAALLAAIGVYGVMSYLVGMRTREMGIRAALGATPAALVRMVLGEAAVRAAIGLALGLGGAFALTQLLQAYLFGVQPRDPLAFTLAPLMLLAVALIATWLPARRAGRVAPMTALRYE
jgi:putative ABC transport system permease protein